MGSQLPLRVWVAIGVTVAALAVLGLDALLGGDDEGEVVSPTTSSTTTETTAVPVSEPIEVQPEWYRKQSSRYSDRTTVATVTTLAPTTTSTTTTTGRGG